jgi:ribonuclease P protein component
MTRVVAREGDPPCVAYAIGRKTGNAVVRNRLRRRLRAVVRDHADRFSPGYAYLIGAAPGAAEATSRDLDRAVRALLDVSSRSS